MSSTITVKNKDGISRTVNLPVITNIEDVFNVMLTETSTIIYGFRNRFVMDMGTKRSFTLTCERVNPPNYNDSSLNWDDWSNGKWMTEFIALLDPWQNMMGQQEGDKKSYVGGFTLNLDSCDTTLFPKRTFNVFLNGSISPTYGVQLLKFTLPLSVGRMTGTKADVAKYSITLNSGEANKGSIAQSYPVGSEIPIPSCPASWIGAVQTKTFSHWTNSSGTMLLPGRMYTWSKSDTLTAQWKAPLKATDIYHTAGEGTVTVPSSATRCIAYVIGAGGGGGGNGTYGYAHTLSYYAGGAGGAGEMKISSFTVRGGEEISYSIGSGGSGGTATVTTPKAGSDGEDTEVVYGIRRIKARGGAGGQGRKSTLNPPAAAGGKYYYAGGDSGQSGSTDDSEGHGGVPGVRGSTVTEDGATFSGGAGGGAAPLYHKFSPTGITYISRGGHGAGKGDPTPPVFGGGGGTSASEGGGSGADGFVALIFYE